MYKDERFELISNLTNILEKKENNMYEFTKENINKDISMTLKTWCKI